MLFRDPGPRAAKEATANAATAKANESQAIANANAANAQKAIAKERAALAIEAIETFSKTVSSDPILQSPQFEGLRAVAAEDAAGVLQKTPRDPRERH